MEFLWRRARHLALSHRDSARCLAAIQKLFGSFKGDAFDKRVLPFFMSVMIFRLVNYRFDDGAIETKIISLR